MEYTTHQEHTTHKIETQASPKLALKRRIELLARIVECSSDAIFSVSEGVITTWNRGAERLYGYTAQEAVGKEFTALLWPVEEADAAADLRALLSPTAELTNIETFHVHKEGAQVPVNMTISPLTDANEEFIGVSVIARVIPEAGQTQGLHEQMTEIREFARRIISQKEEMEALSVRMETLSDKDPLTGLMNRRTLNLHLERECRRAARYCAPLSLLLLDIDHSHQFTESYGSRASDDILRRVANLILQEIRTTDLAARYDADLFCVVLTNTDREGAVVIAERLREQVEEIYGAAQQVAVSVGSATFSHTMETGMALISEADKALYLSKQDGRNRVTHFDERFDFEPFRAGWAAARSRSYEQISLESSNSSAIAAVNASALPISKKDLGRAYDTTIEGWSRMLDQHDKETEGHSQRVMKMAVRLAQLMGVSREELVYLRWGALLHDIGKLGVPDSILLKPEPLTPEEWEIMRSHTTLAYDMLSSIAFMHPALDIPFSHHERWDGTGYPQGLKGEQIPLAARIFAVVDVWDALRSVRPYRKAWSEREALDHIYSLSGKHFDPQVVQAFHRMVQDDHIESPDPPAVSTP